MQLPDDDSGVDKQSTQSDDNDAAFFQSMYFEREKLLQAKRIMEQSRRFGQAMHPADADISSKKILAF